MPDTSKSNVSPWTAKATLNAQAAVNALRGRGARPGEFEHDAMGDAGGERVTVAGEASADR